MLYAANGVTLTICDPEAGVYCISPEDLAKDIKFWAATMAGIAVVCFISSIIMRYSYGILGGNVTLAVRKLLYFNVLQKNIGWFDHRENGVSVLTSAMAEDTSLINGVSVDSLGPQVEGMGAMLVGLGIGFYYCWQEALVCLAVSPVMMIGNALNMKLQAGLSEENNEQKKESDLLCGDAINNFKTVQSFGYENLILANYMKMVEPMFKKSKSVHIQSGVAFGMSQFALYVVFAAMFWAGAEIIKANTNEDGTLELDPDAVFTALFAIMFGASHAGTAQGFGPDMGKAKVAADRIFKIIEHPSQINAIEMDEKKQGKSIDLATFEGRVEFNNVWFRYPTRKEDFVLRGLNLKINPQEKVALVGESGCGKSTFVNLLMRFYDVDHGEVLVDGVNVKDYNLHELRKAISLVMQEPIIFNYSILENVLYGKTDATNSEILEACEVSNCNEFINAKKVLELDENAASLIKEMEKNKDAIVALVGQAKFDEEMDLLKKLETQEEKKGNFIAIEGDVDTRE